MTAWSCGNCGAWIGTFYEGNENSGNHTCREGAVKALNAAQEILTKMDNEYYKKRGEITQKFEKIIKEANEDDFSGEEAEKTAKVLRKAIKEANEEKQ